MYKILICDDEKIVLDSLQYIIQKSFGSECVLEFARTGRTAIELAETFQPDIMITDIHMPGINGIDAMKEILQHNPKILCVVMTAFDKFEYAKESANLGVFQFLNKPVNQNTVVDTINRAMRFIEEQRERRSYDLEMKEKLENIVPIIENGFIYSLLLESDYAGELDQYTSLLDTQYDHGYMMVIEWGELREGYRLSNPIGASIKALSFQRELREYIKEFFQGYVGAMTSNKVTVYVPYEFNTMEYNDRIAIIEVARVMVRKLMKRIDYDFRVGIGTIETRMNARDSYRGAINALKCGHGKVVHVDDLESTTKKEYSIEEEQKLYDAILSGNVAQTIRLAEQIIAIYAPKENDSYQTIQWKLGEIILTAQIKIKESKKTQLKNHVNPLSIIAECADYESLGRQFTEIVEELCESVEVKEEVQVNEMIGKALEYIKTNFKHNVSLDDVSRVVNVSSYYFSKVFKESMKENFIDYLTKLRIEEAKKLLGDKQISVKEICVEVGYGDPNYFSRIFKKYEGITPTEYRENNV